LTYKYNNRQQTSLATFYKKKSFTN